MTAKIMEATTGQEQVQGELFCMSTLFSDDPDSIYEQHPLVAYKVTQDPDSMYMHEAMHQPDKEEFKKAMGSH